jgi:proline iminopeptidase
MITAGRPSHLTLACLDEDAQVNPYAEDWSAAMNALDPILYPAIEPYQSDYLKVSSLHQLYFEQCGNPQGMPVLFVHGGPGGGCEPMYRRYFDPETYRIILFDQRGAGRSRPLAELTDNTTPHLIADIERLREQLSLDRWLVFGGSWGSTLGLAYAEAHPNRVTGLILRGIFLCRQSEIQWFYQGGAHHIFPDLWERYLAPIPEHERHDLVGAYYRRLIGDDRETQLAAAKAWSTWEAGTSKLFVSQELLDRFEHPDFAVAFARIECHYFVHDSFLEPNQLLRDVYKIRHLPGIIIQGRYDVVCPARSAWELHGAWPEAEFHVVPDAGHSATEVGIATKLIEATNDFRDRLQHR